MFCTKCGANVPEGAGFCNACGTPVGGAAVARVVAPAGVVAPAAYAAPVAPSFAPNVAYAGFWLRFVAHVIDSAIFAVIFFVLLIITVLALGGGAFLASLKDLGDSGGVLPAGFIIWLLVLFPALIVVTWLYYAKMESSPSQGTLGKIALGLIVTDMEGRRITFGRASGRFFAKMITGMIPLAIGYIMAGFTEKKQALHDMIATCLVLRKL
jgi:uncharacterized RDD family membrane protein YckC